ncbi:hypothetical protein [Pseudomonas khavaziana]|uniref:hypothetical protein n=1 Tax=Pseudomonas khavaziana TaxID=2842351 RepID=UPI001C3C95A1|nr:hypothetical protein [Pseudomonas khavaziana]MBV4483883.1 hypothetical protein [Pseudomonas khavaziana]
MFFPFSNAERLLILLQANPWRVAQEKSPYIALAYAPTVSADLQKVATEQNVGVLQPRSLAPIVESLSGLADDRVYVDGHGEPACELFIARQKKKLKAAKVADRLVRTFRLPAHVEIRITACWGTSLT